MGYTTDLSILKTAYGYDNNIRVGCPALWMVNYYDSSDPLEALALGTLDPNANKIFGLGFDNRCFNGYCYPRGLMWPKLNSVGGSETVGHSSQYSFDAFKDNIDAYFQKQCTFNSDTSKNANVINLYITKLSATAYQYVCWINVPKDSAFWDYATRGSVAGTVGMVSPRFKFPKSILTGPRWPYNFIKSDCSFVPLDTNLGKVYMSKIIYSSDASTFASMTDLYNALKACAQQNLPVGMFMVGYY